jgi:sulfide dehydrogenase [flavocytochrome c] flavoprotein subunit
MLNRRQFGLLLGSSATVLAASRLAAPAYAQARPKVVVVGGGPGSATAAKYIAKESGNAIEVTLVEPTKQFTTCFHSNLYLGGFKPLEAITHTYEKLASAYGEAPDLRKQTQQENIGWYSGITADIFG